MGWSPSSFLKVGFSTSTLCCGHSWCKCTSLFLGACNVGFLNVGYLVGFSKKLW